MTVGGPPDLSVALDQIRSAVTDQDRLVRAVASGQRRGESVPWRRVELRYVELRSGLSLQLTTYDDKQAIVQNADAGTVAAEELLNSMLDLPFANWRTDSTHQIAQLRITRKGRPMLHVEARDQPVVVDRSHDRQKPRMLAPGHPALRAVGISDRDGNAKPSRQAKYRQIDEFLRLLTPAVDSAIGSHRIPQPTTARPLRLVDLGCGNAYLTFAAGAYLRDVRHLPAQLVGVDVRDQARRRNSEVAAEAGLSESLTFVTSTIAAVELAERPDVVLSLHACDTATDEALARAIRWQAPVILAAPCCHHDIQTQLDGASAPQPYGAITRHGILRERFADVLTDSFRAALLRLHGYRVDAVQFVGSEHTPRNTLLRAVHTDAQPPISVRDEYTQLADAWGVKPALARMLEEPATSKD